MEELKKEICLELLDLFELAKVATEPLRGEMATMILAIIGKVEELKAN